MHQNCNASLRRSGVGASRTGLCHYLHAGGAALLAGQSAPLLDVLQPHHAPRESLWAKCGDVAAIASRPGSSSLWSRSRSFRLISKNEIAAAVWSASITWHHRINAADL